MNLTGPKNRLILRWMVYGEFIVIIFFKKSTQKRKKEIRILVIELILFRISTYFLSFNGYILSQLLNTCCLTGLDLFCPLNIIENNILVD
jgi:hypothetical protein